MCRIKTAAEMYALGQISFQQLEEACGGPVPQVVQDYVKAYTNEFNAHQAYCKAKSETTIRGIFLRSYIQRQEHQQLNPVTLIVFQDGRKVAVIGCSKGTMRAWLKRHPEVEVYKNLKVGDTFRLINYRDLQQEYGL